MGLQPPPEPISFGERLRTMVEFVFQKTLKNAITCSGVGLHSGVKVSMTLHPAEADHGIVFRRTDIVGGQAEIAALWNNVVPSQLCTAIANRDGVQIQTIEHLMAAFAGLGAPRVLFRIYKDRGLAGLGWLRSRKDDRVPVALIGINHTAENFIRAMDSGRGGDYRVVGIIDERGDRIGRQIRNCTVVGSLATLEDTVERLAQNGDRPQRILIADEHVSRTELRNLVERADVLGISVARLPRPTDFKSGIAIDRTEIRPIAIEDLLGRPQTVLDRARMQALIAGKKVLVTGAGGSIGSELCRQLALLEPAALLMLDRDESGLHAVQLSIDGKALLDSPDLILADIRDSERMMQVFLEIGRAHV